MSSDHGAAGIDLLKDFLAEYRAIRTMPLGEQIAPSGSGQLRRRRVQASGFAMIRGYQTIRTPKIAPPVSRKADDRRRAPRSLISCGVEEAETGGTVRAAATYPYEPPTWLRPAVKI